MTLEGAKVVAEAAATEARQNDWNVVIVVVDANGDLLHLQRMEGIYVQTNGKTDTPHRHDYYTLIWVQNGEGHHVIDFNKYPLSQNAVFFVSPGEVHQVVTLTQPQGWVVTFSKAFLKHTSFFRCII